MKLNTIIQSLILISILLVSGGCKTVDKVYVTAPENTKLYIPGKPDVEYSVITNGPAVVEVPGDSYYGYILAKDPNTGLKMPYGMDVKHKSYFGEKLGVGVGYTLGGIGTGAFFSGTLLVIIGGATDDGDITTTGGMFMGIGAGVAGIGAAIGVPAEARLSQNSHQYQFTYVKNQNITFPNLATKLLHPDAPKGSSGLVEKNRRNRAVSSVSEPTDMATSTPAKRITSTKATRTVGNKAKKIAGAYTGSGKLSQDSEEIEFYQDVTVTINRIDNNRVEVSIVESGEEYFANPLIYNIEKESKGVYTLALENMPAQKIIIDKNGKLQFRHDKVNIDDVIYTLILDLRKK